MKLGGIFGAAQPRTLAKTPQKPQTKQPEQPSQQPTTPALAAATVRRRPGDFGIQWPKQPQQKVKDYKPILTLPDLEAYLERCEETGYGSFDWETAPSEEAREAWREWAAENRRQHAEAMAQADLVRSQGFDNSVPDDMTKKQADAELKRRQKEHEADVKIWLDKAAALDDEYEARKAAYLKSPLDPWKGEICTVSIAATPHETRVIPISHKTGRNFEQLLDRDQARKLVMDTLDHKLFRNRKVVKIAVNLSFETKYAAKYGKYILMPVADPLVMWVRCMQLAFPGKIKDPKKPASGWGLKPMTKTALGVNMGEFKDLLAKHGVDFFDEIPADSGDGLLYSAEDSDYGLQNYLFWLPVARALPKYDEWLRNIEMPFSRVIGLMEYWGMAWDKETAELKRREAEAAQLAAADEIKRICKEALDLDVNPGKTGKTNGVKHVLFSIMQLPLAKTTDAGNISLDEEALIDIRFMLENKLHDLDEEKYLAVELPESWEVCGEWQAIQEGGPEWYALTADQQKALEIRRRKPHPYRDAGLALLEQMVLIQKMTTLLSSHLEGREKYANPVSGGRIHAEYTPWTDTARLNSMKPNGQNVPRLDNDTLGVRNMYKAPPGRILFFIDFSGFELRLLAWKSGDEVMIEIFRTGGDMHRKTAASIADKPESEVTKKERTDAKPANFGRHTRYAEVKPTQNGEARNASA
jgi:DNA polymerase-1